jgi:hypothetical protein
MHLSLRLAPDADDRAVAAAAARRGMDVPPLSRYHLAEPRPGLILHYASVPAAEIRRGVGLLRAALDEAGTGRLPASADPVRAEPADARRAGRGTGWELDGDATHSLECTRDTPGAGSTPMIRKPAAIIST